MGFVKIINKDRYKEKPELYKEEIYKVCEILNCDISDLFITTSDEDFLFVKHLEKLNSGNMGLIEFEGAPLYLTYNKRGAVFVFSKIWIGVNF